MELDAAPAVKPPGSPGESVSSPRGLKKLVHQYLEEAPNSFGPQLVQLGVMVVIIVNVAAVVVETMNTEISPGTWKPLGEQYPFPFSCLEWFSVAVFTLEYLLRLWCVTVDPQYSHPVKGRLRFATSPMALVDLLAILPTYFQVAGFRATRALRLLRIFRIFKLGRYSVAVRSLNNALVSKRAELGVTAFVIMILLVLTSTVMYYAEYDAQRDKFSSIPAAMWWSIATLTTVGYGDIFPITALGKLAAGISAVLGIGMVALPAGILGSAFMQELNDARALQEKDHQAEQPHRCPHCGKEI